MKKTVFTVILLASIICVQAQNYIKSDSTQTTFRITGKDDKSVTIRGAINTGQSAEYQKALDQARKNLKDAQRAFEAMQGSKELEAAFVKAQKAVFEAEKNIKLGSPLIFFDNKEVASFSDINPDNIQSISVLKDVESISKYGDKGKNGVVLITSKKSQMTPEMIDKARFEYISKAINLTEKQRPTFEKIYHKCDEQMKAHRQGTGSGYQRGKALTAEQVLSELDRSATMPACRAQMYKDLKKVLSDEQIVLLYNAERHFMSSMLRSGRNINVTVREAHQGQHPTSKPLTPKK